MKSSISVTVVCLLGHTTVQTASKCLIKPSLSLQFIQTPRASVTVFAWTKPLGMTAQPRVSGTELQGDF